jgi:hypothetical protein
MVLGDRSMPPGTRGTGPVASPVSPFPGYVARGPGVRWRAIRGARDRDGAGTPGVLWAEVDYVDAVAGVEVRVVGEHHGGGGAGLVDDLRDL